MSPTPPRTADELRQSFIDFFAARDHTPVPSASLIPHDPTLLFNVAGMVPFKPYFVGDEQPPFRRAVSSQKCVRAGGKHNDLDDVGRTKRHLVFFEMMGNFSFGDYFKELAIPLSWELVTEVWGFDGDRIWVTVHDSDDEAEKIWHDVVGVPMERIQRLGDKDNFWQMGDTGPCGPCSELHIDRGPAFGPDGGPLHDPHGDRFMEFWNLVFMQYDQAPDGTRTALPRPSIDTGAGLERILCLLQGVDAVWETDLMAPLVDQACSLTGRTYRPGDYDDRDSFAVRVLAEHARSSAMLVADGVFPSNEARGFVLRRIIRRAVRYAYLLGTEQLVMPSLAEVAVDVMGNAYPDVARQRDFIVGVLGKEEERFRQTLRNGLTILESELVGGTGELSGSTAFVLHDTYGFPLELTQEIAGERDVAVDVAGFETEMAEQRQRAKAARRKGGDDANVDAYREVVEQFGTTDVRRLHRGHLDGPRPAVVPVASREVGRAAEEAADERSEPECRRDLPRPHPVLRRERRPGRRPRHDHHRDRHGRGPRHDVRPAQPAPPHRPRHQRHDHARPGRHGGHRRRPARRHPAQPHRHPPAAPRPARGARRPRQAGRLARRARPAALRLLALRAGHARADRADRAPGQRRDAGQHRRAGVRDDQGRGRGDGRHRLLRRQVRRHRARPRGRLVGRAVRRHPRAGHRRHRHDQGRQRGLDRLQPAAHRGRHRRGQRGPPAARRAGARRRGAGSSARPPDDLVGGVQRKLDELRALADEVKVLRAKLATGRAGELAATAADGAVVQRVDGLAPGDLRDLAIAVRNEPGVDVVVLAGETPTGGVSLVAAVRPGLGVEAAALLRDAARAVGGGGGGKGDIATAGGKDPGRPRRGPAHRRRCRRRPSAPDRAGARPRPRLEAHRRRRQRPRRARSPHR